MSDRPDFHELIARNRRATWGLLFAFFLLLCVVSSSISYGIGAGLIGVIIAIIFSGGTSYSGYVSSKSLALRATGAHPATREEYLQLHNIVEGIAIAAAIPMPEVYVVEDPAPNAFATGRNPENAAVAVTTGLLAKMERDELEGVIAHEIAHIRNYDILVMTAAVATAGSIALMVDLFWRMLYFGGNRRGGNDDGPNPLVIVGVIAVAILAPLAAAMMKAAVSRRREALADATAVELTRYPSGLRKALEKLDADSTQVSRTSHATSHLWIETPDDHQDNHRGRRFNDMFDTHPPLAERINLLREMEGIEPYTGPTESEPLTRRRDTDLAEPGWYVDPSSPTGRLRYWDGLGWTTNTR